MRVAARFWGVAFAALLVLPLLMNCGPSNGERPDLHPEVEQVPPDGVTDIPENDVIEDEPPAEPLPLELQEMQRDLLVLYRQLDADYELLAVMREQFLHEGIEQLPDTLSTLHLQVSRRHMQIAQQHAEQMELVLDYPVLLQNQRQLMELNQDIALWNREQAEEVRLHDVSLELMQWRQQLLEHRQRMLELIHRPHAPELNETDPREQRQPSPSNDDNDLNGEPPPQQAPSMIR